MSTCYGYGPLGKAHLAGWIPSINNGISVFDPLNTSASKLQELLTSGEITSVRIAVYQLAPGAIDRAEELDKMRSNGVVLGPLHGIPILLKDNIGMAPNMQMDNTGGNLALVGSTVIKNTSIVTQLIEAGTIILGKTTLSATRGKNISCGWSALHGQSQNPYIPGGVAKSDGPGGQISPGGSSSGSGIAVAAGFAPMAIGTETEGSLISSSTRHYYLDVAGPTCTIVKDTADLLTVLVGNRKGDVPSGGYASAMKGEADPEKFRYNETLQTPRPAAIEQIKTATLQRYDRIKSLAAEYHYDVSLRLDRDFDYEGSNALTELMVADFEPKFDAYMKGTQGAPISSAKELAEWNRAHSNEVLSPEFPNQTFIKQSVVFPHNSDRRQRLMSHITEIGQSLPGTLDSYGINVIIGPADTCMSKFSAATGFLLCSLPLGYIDFNDRPVGLMAIARSEVTLITLMSEFEASFPSRKPSSTFFLLSERSISDSS
ncbi:amidase family protein [Xylaria venustula]|nr:amidase family protein [Xylaria venustula]